MLNVTLIGGTELIARLDTILPGKLRLALKRRVVTLAIKLQAKIVNEKLAGQVLNRITGALSRSIFWEMITDNDSGVVAKVASSGDVKYAAIHEFGGKTPPHDIYPTKGEALHFFAGGKEIFAKVVHHPGSVMPERSFMRSSLREMQTEIIEQIQQAAVEGMKP